MNKLKKLSILTISSAIFAGCSLLPQQAVNDFVAPSDDQVTTQQNDTQVVETQGKYVEYTPTIVKESADQGKKVVLFFHASWCPTCRAAQNDILGRIDEIGDDIVIVKTDYDTYNDLKKKYNITYQHTFVQVDQQGNEITTWNGGDLDEINRNIL